VGTGIPAWAAVSIAVVSGGFGLLGAITAARITARTRDQELRQQRRLTGAEVRLKALDEAAAAGLEYRERIAEALRDLEEGPGRPPAGVEPLRAIDRTDLLVFRKHEAALVLRFGRDHQVTWAWRAFVDTIGEAARLVRDNLQLFAAAGPRLSDEVRDDARRQRHAARKQLDDFLATAASALNYADEGAADVDH
jgi:hypothetical protein